MAYRNDRVALNPIQWIATADGWLDFSRTPEPRALLTLIKEAGFDAVFADVPAGWSVESYRALLDEIGMAPAPGYFSLGMAEDSAVEDAIVARAVAAAHAHAALGLHDLVVSSGMTKDSPRVIHPARGFDADRARLDRIVRLLKRVAEAMLAEGVRAAFHPHVGTWVETEEETRTVLEAVDERIVAFAPDTGHLAWADADVRQLIADYAARVTVVHVKDCRLSVARPSRQQDLTYQQTVQAGLWVEPGRGELDLTDMFSALPTGFDGWLEVEVDKPDIADPYESAQASAAWMRAHAR